MLHVPAVSSGNSTLDKNRSLEVHSGRMLCSNTLLSNSQGCRSYCFSDFSPTATNSTRPVGPENSHKAVTDTGEKSREERSNSPQSAFIKSLVG